MDADAVDVTTRQSVPISTRWGVFVAHFTDAGLAALDFPRDKDDSHDIASGSASLHPWYDVTKAALLSALQDGRVSELPPFDLRDGSPFQQRVWRALQTIPAGETITYGQLAKLIGQPGAVRAVGRACGANPIPVLIPCHRVLAADRKIGGFSGGLKWKERLLGIEGHTGFASLFDV